MRRDDPRRHTPLLRQPVKSVAIDHRRYAVPIQVHPLLVRKSSTAKPRTDYCHSGALPHRRRLRRRERDQLRIGGRQIGRVARMDDRSHKTGAGPIGRSSRQPHCARHALVATHDDDRSRSPLVRMLGPPRKTRPEIPACGNPGARWQVDIPRRPNALKPPAMVPRRTGPEPERGHRLKISCRRPIRHRRHRPPVRIDAGGHAEGDNRHHRPRKSLDRFVNTSRTTACAPCIHDDIRRLHGAG